MGYSAIQYQPIAVTLTTEANSTGWSVSGPVATHSSCQAGNITLLSYPVTAGHIYQISYQILNISGGYVQANLGGEVGISRTTTGLFVETITATYNGYVLFYSNANCSIQAFNISDKTQQAGTTLAYNPSQEKWSDFRDYYPDWGISLYEQSLVAGSGAFYVSNNGQAGSNTYFGGVSYPSIIQLVCNGQPKEVKTYKSLSVQSDQLWVTTVGGITTSLGQISDLEDLDFVKGILSDSSGSTTIYTKEGVYSAQFLRDKNTDLLNGDKLKGNWALITLTTGTGNLPVALFTVEVNEKISKIGVR